jgi:hypothetical protein
MRVHRMCGIASCVLDFSSKIRMSSQFHVLAALPTGNEALVCTLQEAGWVQESLEMMCLLRVQSWSSSNHCNPELIYWSYIYRNYIKNTERFKILLHTSQDWRRLAKALHSVTERQNPSSHFHNKKIHHHHHRHHLFTAATATTAAIIILHYFKYDAQFTHFFLLKNWGAS